MSYGAGGSVVSVLVKPVTACDHRAMDGRGHVHVGVLFGLAVISWINVYGFGLRWAGTRWPNAAPVQGAIALH